MIYINQKEGGTYIEGSAEDILCELGVIVSDIEEILAKHFDMKTASGIVDVAVEAGKVYNRKHIFKGGGSGSPCRVEEDE